MLTVYNVGMERYLFVCYLKFMQSKLHLASHEITSELIENICFYLYKF